MDICSYAGLCNATLMIGMSDKKKINCFYVAKIFKEV